MKRDVKTVQFEVKTYNEYEKTRDIIGLTNAVQEVADENHEVYRTKDGVLLEIVFVF